MKPLTRKDLIQLPIVAGTALLTLWILPLAGVELFAQGFHLARWVVYVCVFFAIQRFLTFVTWLILLTLSPDKAKASGL